MERPDNSRNPCADESLPKEEVVAPTQPGVLAQFWEKVDGNGKKGEERIKIRT